jgi:predicted MFS family arabinose efflux permease
MSLPRVPKGEHRRAPHARPTPGHRARALAVFCAALGGFIDLYFTQAIYPALQARFGITVVEAGSLVTATTLTLALVAPFANALSRRMGSRRATLLGLAGLVLSVALMSLAQQTSQLVLLRIAQGLLIPLVLVSVLRSTPSGLPAREAVALAASYVSGGLVGGVLGRLLPAQLLPLLGWQNAMLALAALQAALLAVAAWRLPRGAVDAAPATHAAPALPRGQAMAALAELGLAGFSLLFAQAAVYTYVAIRLASPPHGWTTAQLGAIYLAFLPSLVFVHATQPLSARWGAARTLAAATAAGLVGLLLSLAPHDAAVVLALTLFSAGVFVCQAVLAQWVSATEQRCAGLPVAGIYLSCYYLGASAGALVPAALWPRFGWPGCLALVIGVQLATAIVRKLLKLRSPQKQGS